MKLQLFDFTTLKQYALAQQLRDALKNQDLKAASNILENKDNILAHKLDEMRDLKQKICDKDNHEQETISIKRRI